MIVSLINYFSPVKVTYSLFKNISNPIPVL